MKVKSTLIALIALFYSNFVNAQNTLDNIGLNSSTPASVAFSLRQLSTSYTGPLVRIKVGSSYYDVYPDSSTKNFSLSSKISAAIGTYNAVVAVAGANALNTIITCTTDATVAIWYDQSGNAVNVLTSATTGPKIITQGSFQLMSGKPSIYFAAVSANTSPLVSTTTVNYSAQQTATVNAVAQNVGSTSNISGIYSTGLSGGWGLNYDPTASAPGYWLDGSGCNQAFSGVTSTTPKIVTGFLNKSNSSSIIYENSVLKGTKTMTCNIANGTADNICIGIRASNGGTRKFDGYISEVILFPSILISADQATLETNQNTTYFSPSVSISSSATCNTSCAGTSIIFTATPYNFSTTPSYQWYKNGTAISGETNATYTTTLLSNNDQISVRATPATVSATKVTSNLIANLDAGNSSSYNGSGNIWTDLTGNGNNVTLSNAGYSSVNGGGIALNTNGYGTQTLTNSPFNGDFTWSTIFRFNDGIWDWIYNVGGYNGLVLTTLGKPALSWGGWFNNKIDAGAEVALTNGNYYMLTFVRSGNAVSCYLQASPYGIGSNVSGNISLVSPLIGKGPGGEAWPNGIVNLILLYNRALTQSEITQNYNTYAARFGFSAAAISSNTITTTISAPQVTITSSASGAVCSGTAITFTATVGCIPTPTYQWYKNGAIIPGANSSTYSTSSLANNDQINVWVNGGINNSNIVSNGLKLNLDASNPGSYSGTGNTWYDLSGNNNHGTLMNSPTYDAASGSIVTNGTNQYISIPQISSANTNITMQAWVYVNLNTTGTFIKSGTGGGGYSIGIGNWAYDQVGSNVVMLLYGRGWIGSGVSYGTAGWKLVTLTLDGSSTARAYVNGSLIGTYTWPTPTTPSGPLNLGANIGDGNIYYNGKFAAAYFYNRELSLAEITQNYNAFATKTTAYNSNTINISVTGSVPTVTVVGDSCANKTTLSTTTGLTAYAWYKDNAAISGATSNSYIPNSAGDYKVVVANGSCNITSSSTTISNCGLTSDGKMLPTTSSATLVSNEGGTNFGTALNNLGAQLNTTGLTTTTGTIGSTTAVLGGVISSTNGISSSFGVIYSTDANFGTYSTSTIQSNAAAGTYTGTITGLTSLTTYYVKSFVVNRAGTSYGPVVSFTTASPPPPAAGDNYGGGKIFYIFQSGEPGYVAGETHGLIAATSDTQGYRVFGCRGWPAGTSTALGTGAANTTTLLGCWETNFAAKLARAVRDGGYSDWYLPSKDELNKLYINKNIVGNFIETHYWSSSESDSNYAIFQNFGTGAQSNSDKNAQKGIRAIRTF